MSDTGIIQVSPSINRYSLDVDEASLEEFFDLLRFDYGIDVTDYTIEHQGVLPTAGAKCVSFDGMIYDDGFTELTKLMILMDRIEKSKNPAIREMWEQLQMMVKLTR